MNFPEPKANPKASRNVVLPALLGPMRIVGWSTANSKSNKNNPSKNKTNQKKNTNKSKKKPKKSQTKPKSNNKKISFIDLLKKTKRIDKRIDTKLAIYSDLRNKGYIAKSALKFGADFRVYNKGVRPSEDHARWLLIASKENEKLDYNDFAAKNRIANSTKKRLLIAILDDEGDVSYYETSWIKT
jgi:tRNA-intron endonuclease